MDTNTFNDELAKLIEAWCERRELRALAEMLPAYLQNNGLTEGWYELHHALRSGYGAHYLPQDERDILKRLYVELDVALRTR